MKILISIVAILILSITLSLYAEIPLYQNTLSLNILNTTGTPGFIGTCSDKIQQGGKTLCSTIQKIDKGSQGIYVPPYQNSYPVFSTDGADYFTCATLDKPNDQLFFTTQDIKSNTLLLESFILDQNKNKVAVLCGLEPK